MVTSTFIIPHFIPILILFFFLLLSKISPRNSYLKILFKSHLFLSHLIQVIQMSYSSHDASLSFCFFQFLLIAMLQMIISFLSTFYKLLFIKNGHINNKIVKVKTYAFASIFFMFQAREFKINYNFLFSFVSHFIQLFL